MKKYLHVVALFIISAGILLSNLGGQGLALDEPETIAVARSISKFGVPSAWDGKNLQFVTTTEAYRVVGEAYIWKWHPWVQHYLVYLSENFMGKTLATDRLPFALFGVATVLLTYFIAKEMFQKKNIAFIVALQLLFLLPFFLYVRQARYYAPNVFFSLLYFYFTLRILREKYIHPLILFVAGLILFMTNYQSWLSTMVISFPIIVYKRNQKLFGVSTLGFVFSGIWYLFFHPYGGNLLISNGDPRAVLQNLLHYFSYINKFLLPFYWLPFIIWNRNRPDRKIFYLITGWIIVKVLLLTVFLTPHGRYLTELAPVLVLLMGYVYLYFGQFSRIFVYCIFLILVIPSSGRLLSELRGFYPTMDTQIGAYINSMAGPGDLFWSNTNSIDIYLSSGVPNLSSVCPQGPTSVINPEFVRWFIFFQYDSRLPQNLDNIPCFGPGWQQKLETEFTRRPFSFQVNTYLKNDSDIVNRQFPPRLIAQDQVIIYEKKTNITPSLCLSKGFCEP